MTNRETIVDLFGELPFETLVSEIKDFAIFHLDKAGIVRSWNFGAEVITGFAADDVVGKHFSELFTPEDRERGVPEAELEKAERVGRAEDRRWHQKKDGQRFFADGVTTSLRDDNGDLLGFAKIARDATETKLTEDALVESNRRSVNILESISDAFYAVDHQWRFTYVNKQAEALLHRSAAELLGKNIWEEFPEAVGLAFYEHFRRAFAEQVTVSFEEYFPPLKGWFELRAYPSPDGLSVYFQNVNERKQIEATRLERSRTDALVADVSSALVQFETLPVLLQACCETLLKHLDVAFARIWTFNDEAQVLELQASAGLYTHLDGGHSRVPIGQFKIGTIAAERRPHLTNDVQNDPRVSDKDWARREGMTAFAGYPLIVDDKLVGVMCVFSRRPLSKATLETMAAVSNSIASVIERKRIESALQQSEEQYRIVAETASDAIISIDEQSTIIFINKAGERIFGHAIDDMIGQKLTMLMPESYKDVHRQGFQRYLETGIRKLEWEHVEVEGLRRDGTEFPLELSFGEFQASNARIFIGIGRDISSRKRAEALIRESEAKFATLADVVPQLVWMAEPDGYIFWYNQNWYTYTGTTPADMEGWGWQSVHDPTFLEDVVTRWKISIDTGAPFEMEFPLRGADGQFRWFLTRVNPLRDTDGRIIRWFGTNTDIDEQRRLHQRNRFILELDEAVRPLTNPDEITLTLARLLGEHLGADRCAYAVVEADEEHFHIPGDYARGVGSIVGRYRMSQFGDEVGRLMRDNQTYVVSDVNTDPRVDETVLAAYRMTEIQALICVPLHKNGKFSACMAVHQNRPRVWQPEEVALVSFVANRFWESIERARLLKSLEVALVREQEARRSAEEANRIKDDFLATVSHELRTPLNSILGWANMLRSGTMPASDTERALRTVERNARSQARLIDDLLDISRIVNGKLSLEIETLDLKGVVDAAVEAVRPGADAKGIAIYTVTDAHIGPITGDAARLQQVVWNLLSNAVKFTPPGGKVEVRAEPVVSHIEITVTDTGKGIDPRFLPFVFDRFRQADQTRTRSHGGLGLGLSIVRQLIEMHGGSVEVASEGVGLGSTFLVKLPRNARAAVAGNNETEHGIRADLPKTFELPPDLKGVRILIVDDETDSLELLEEVLRKCGADVRTADTAAVALGRLGEESFDVLVSDIGMPDEDGYSLIQKVRKLPAENGGQVPAVALTAYAREEDRLQALEAGFQAHVPKPVEPFQLAAFVAKLAGSRPPRS